MPNKNNNHQFVRSLFSDNSNFPFDGLEEVPSFHFFISKTLSEAESLYYEKNHAQTYPNFKDFLASHHVETIAYNVYHGYYEQ